MVNNNFDLNFNILSEEFIYDLFYHILTTRDEYLLYFLKKIHEVNFLKNIELPKNIDRRILNKTLQLRLEGYNKNAIIEKLDLTKSEMYKLAIERAKTLDITDERVMAELLESKLKKYYTSLYVNSLFDILIKDNDTDYKLNIIEKEIKKYYNSIDFKTDFKELSLSFYDKIFEEKKPTKFVDPLYPTFHRIFKKGLETTRLYIIGGASGRGKSTFLQNIALNLVKSGNIVYHFTLENSLEETMDRYISNITEIPMSELNEKEEEVRIRTDKFLLQTKGKLFIKEYPVHSLSKEDILNYIKTKKLSDGITPDVIIVDYLDIMNTYVKFNEMRFKLSQIANDLKSIAQTTNTVVITATQLNRESVRKTTSDEANVSESYGKIHIADAFLTLNSTKKEKKNNTIRLYVAKNRVGVSAREYLFKVDFSIMKFTDLDTEVDEEYLNSIKDGKGNSHEDENFDFNIGEIE